MFPKKIFLFTIGNIQCILKIPHSQQNLLHKIDAGNNFLLEIYVLYPMLTAEWMHLVYSTLLPYRIT
jgi:hypothetical protein